MASGITTSTNNDSESCTLCISRHNRNRPSFCQCKHCSIPLCFDCMKQHHEELLLDVEQISHDYNQVQELVQTKQTMIDEETAKSIENVNQYFDHYIDELRDTQKKIIEAMEKVKQDAHEHVHQMGSDLRKLGNEIRSLTKESIVQMTKMKNASIELKKMEQKVTSYKAIRAENAIQTKPDFSIKFESSTAELETPQSTFMETNEICSTELKEPPVKTNLFNIFPQPSTAKEFLTTLSTEPKEPPVKTNLFNIFSQPPTAGEFLTTPSTEPKEPPVKTNLFNIFNQSSAVKGGFTTLSTQNKDVPMSNDDEDSDSDENLVETSYDVARMASAGANILYTSYHNKGSDIIAYCLVDDDDDDNDDDDDSDDADDQSREWNPAQIKDMIWWSAVDKYICATENGIYTVEYKDKKFKIAGVIREKWSFIRIASNTTHLFLWAKSVENNFYGIEVYSNQFKYLKTIDLGRCGNPSIINNCVSFCVTDNMIASVFTEKQYNREICRVAFCDMDAKQLQLVEIGECNSNNTEIRTNGTRFFLTTGQRQLHNIMFGGDKKTITLQKYGKRIAILDGQRVAVSNGRFDIEIIKY